MPGEGGWPAGVALLRNACGQGGPVGARGLLLSYRHNGHSRHQATGRSPFSVGGCGRMGPWRPHSPSLLPSTPRMQDALVAPPVRTRRCLLLTPPHPHARCGALRDPDPHRSTPPEGGPRGLLQLWPPCPPCRLLPPALASFEPASWLVPQVQEHGSQWAWAGGETGQNPGPLVPVLGPQPSGSASHLEPSRASWLCLEPRTPLALCSLACFSGAR